MRILHLYKDYWPLLGGIENHIRVLAEAQAHRGHEVTVLAANRGWRTRVQDVNGVRVILAARFGTIASTPISPSLYTWLARLEADVVHLHFPHPPGEVARLLIGGAGATVITYHSDIVRQRRLLLAYEPLLRRVLLRADRILVTSPAYAGTSPYLQEFRDKCTVVPLGIELERFEQDRIYSLAAGRARWGLPRDRPVIVFVGRFRYYKGLDYLLRALPLVPDVHVLLVGGGPLLDHLRGITRRLGVTDRVVFTGEVDDSELPACYQVGDVFVLPSHTRAEAFGTSIVEAMAAGLPVISTEIGTGTSWVNQSGLTGLVVPPCDPAALAAAIKSLVDDPGRRSTMGQAGRSRANHLFGASTMVDAVEQVYKEVLGKR
ncbi:MAG TPA: glycosyltransferase [Vicinamibacterales bacterium]|jgi:rhamnosyl/mannosyltransferase